MSGYRSVYRHALLLAPSCIFLFAAALALYDLKIPLCIKVASASPLLAYALLAFPDTPRRWSGRLGLILLAIGLGGLAALTLYGLSRPWIDHAGFNGAVWSTFARVIERFGFCQTGGRLYWTGGDVFVASAPQYNRHPPGLVWLIALAFRVFGVREGAARMVPILFTMCGVIGLTFFLARRLGAGAAVGLFLVLLASPGFSFFGRMVNFEPVVLSVALSFYAILLMAPPSKWATWLLTGLAMITPLLGWVGTPVAIGGAYSLARYRFAWTRRRSLGFALLPLLATIYSIGFVSDWACDVSSWVERATMWNNLIHPDMTSYSCWDWLLRVWRNGQVMMPAPLWIFLPLLPFAGLKRTRANMLLWGIVLPFVIMIALMPHAVYVHNYHLIFVWILAALSFTHLMARFGPKTVLRLAVSLALLLPIRAGLSELAHMHAPNRNAVRQYRTGSELRSVSSPADHVAIVNTVGDPEPILGYYLDRHATVYHEFAPALADSTCNYYCFRYGFRGLTKEEGHAVTTLFTQVPGMLTPTFVRRAATEVLP